MSTATLQTARSFIPRYSSRKEQRRPAEKVLRFSGSPFTHRDQFCLLVAYGTNNACHCCGPLANRLRILRRNKKGSFLDRACDWSDGDLVFANSTVSCANPCSAFRAWVRSTFAVVCMHVLAFVARVHLLAQPPKHA